TADMVGGNVYAVNSVSGGFELYQILDSRTQATAAQLIGAIDDVLGNSILEIFVLDYGNYPTPNTPVVGTLQADLNLLGVAIRADNQMYAVHNAGGGASQLVRIDRDVNNAGTYQVTDSAVLGN